MKVLVVQLARLGDLLLTTPVLRALRRTHPDWDLHLLLRKSFSAGAGWVPSDIQIHSMDTPHILGPVLGEPVAWTEALDHLGSLVNQLRSQKFDLVINLTFSAASSYLVHQLGLAREQTRGYTRHGDGYLDIPDDPSAYFYGQVGEGTSNRLHLTQIFAEVAGVELVQNDWLPLWRGQKSNQVSVHVGASLKKKTLNPSGWAALLSDFADRTQTQIVLMGAPEEVPLGAAVADRLPPDQVLNRVGTTRFQDLQEILCSSRFLLAADSGPMQLASLLGVPVLCLSQGPVNPCETGPRSVGSRILILEDPNQIDASVLGAEVFRYFRGDRALWQAQDIEDSCGEPRFNYVPSGERHWDLIQSIYLARRVNIDLSPKELAILGQLDETNELCLEQIQRIRQGREVSLSTGLLSRGEELLELVFRQCDLFQPILGWWLTEKVRIGPGTIADVAEGTLHVHLSLRNLIGNLKGVRHEEARMVR